MSNDQPVLTLNMKDAERNEFNWKTENSYALKFIINTVFKSFYLGI